jgi:hypothetical protein
VNESWGRVAAQSHFSWPRAVRWLAQGRPFSHIALFAIQACYHYDTVPLPKHRPVLEEAAPVEEMRQRLEAYYAVDHVPRVRNLVQNIGGLMTGASNHLPNENDHIPD